ncbi:arylacetamide deacetylase [Aplysia californica]|uniref:Arylacetamide deacetylase n=1 Tax=Aplysia californica TaxID=6500 RepID=A0ABM0K128_APLCA|nr:arylacetamide deacetylase [Aplysia californica]
MIIKGLLALTVLSSVFLGLFLYTPLPEGISNPGKTQVVMAFMQLFTSVTKIRELLGYGSLAQDIRTYQEPLGEGSLSSASYGDVDVKRDKLAGVHVIIYRPLPARQKAPATIYFHGGAFVIGSGTFYDQHCYEYAKRSGTVVFCVDYRLAPDHPFPAAIHDSLDVTRYVLGHGDRFGVDVRKVGVAGDSAGGNLAAAVSLKLSKEKSNLPPLIFQVLHEPAMQAFNMRLPSFIDNDLPILTTRTLISFYALYLGFDGKNVDNVTKIISENRHLSPQLYQSKYAEYVDSKLLPEKFRKSKKFPGKIKGSYSEKVFNKIKQVITNPLFSPLMSDDLSGVPPAFVHVAEFDVVRDDGLLFARRLKDAGVKTQLHFSHGGFHLDYYLGAPGLLRTDASQKVMNETFIFIKEISRR